MPETIAQRNPLNMVLLCCAERIVVAIEIESVSLTIGPVENKPIWSNI